MTQFKFGDWIRCPCRDRKGTTCLAKGVIIGMQGDDYLVAVTYLREGRKWAEEPLALVVPWTPDNPDELWASYCAWRLTQ